MNGDDMDLCRVFAVQTLQLNKSTCEQWIQNQEATDNATKGFHCGFASLHAASLYYLDINDVGLCLQH